MRPLALALLAGLAGCMPAVQETPRPVAAQAQPSDLDACAVLPEAGDAGQFEGYLSKTLALPDGRPVFHSLTFLRRRDEAKGRCDFVVVNETTEDDLDTWGAGFMERLGLYSARGGELLTRVAEKVNDQAEIYHAMVQAVRPGGDVYAKLDAERRAAAPR